MSTLDRFNPCATRQKPIGVCRVQGCYERATTPEGRCARCEEEIEALRAYRSERGTDSPRSGWRVCAGILGTLAEVVAVGICLYAFAVVVLGLGQ